MVVLVWRDKTIELPKDKAESLLKDQERRKNLYCKGKKMESWELEDKDLIFKDGVIVRRSKRGNTKEAE